MLDLSRIKIDPLSKGAPLDLEDAVSPAELARHVGNLFDGRIPMPAATIRWDLLEANEALMTSFAAKSAVSIAPHAKTHMAPQLADVQLQSGAWAITVADVRQLRIFQQFGLRRALLANQVVDRASIPTLWTLLERDPDFEVICFVDSAANVAALQAEADRQGASGCLDVLVELGYEGGRTGCRDEDSAGAVIEAILGAPSLRLRGVTAFEGLIGGGGVGEEGSLTDPSVEVRELLERVVRLARSWAGSFSEGEVVLTAGGSAYFDLVVDALGAADLGRPHRVVIRSGGYLVHDSGFYARHEGARRERAPSSPILQSALQVWGAVQSRPEPNLALVTLGRRDISHDLDLPRPELLRRPGSEAAPVPVTGWEVVALNDQHCFVRLPDSTDVQVGDLVGFGISHPCTTFDKWRLLYAVDHEYNVVDAVQTYF